jgi:hypothetical protein
MIAYDEGAMTQSISAEHKALLDDLRSVIARTIALGMPESAELLRMGMFDLHAKIHGVSDGELRELSAAVENVLFSPRAPCRSAKSVYPRRRSSLRGTPNPTAKN